MDFGDVYNPYYEGVKKFILAMVKDEWAADDLIQETFIRVRNHMDQIKDKEKASSWIFKIAYNLCLDHFRARQKHMQMPYDAGDIISAKTGAFIQKKIEQKEMSDCVQQKMRHLPETLKSVLILYDIMAFRHGEIAEILDITVENAKIRLHRARKQLKIILEQECRFQVDERQVLVCEPVEKDRS